MLRAKAVYAVQLSVMSYSLRHIPNSFSILL
jgi:hypothetical protein